jgi:hypothetical protein
MSQIIETSPTSLVVDASAMENIATYSTRDLQYIQSTHRSNGKNYLKWSQLIRIFLNDKGKISHLIGMGPSKKDLKFIALDEQDSMLMSWLWNSMQSEISDTCMFFETAKEIQRSTMPHSFMKSR